MRRAGAGAPAVRVARTVQRKGPAQLGAPAQAVAVIAARRRLGVVLPREARRGRGRAAGRPRVGGGPAGSRRRQLPLRVGVDGVRLHQGSLCAGRARDGMEKKMGVRIRNARARAENPGCSRGLAPARTAEIVIIRLGRVARVGRHVRRALQRERAEVPRALVRRVGAGLREHSGRRRGRLPRRQRQHGGADDKAALQHGGRRGEAGAGAGRQWRKGPCTDCKRTSSPPSKNSLELENLNSCGEKERLHKSRDSPGELPPRKKEGRLAPPFTDSPP